MVVLADVPGLSPVQAAALAKFIAEGGGLLVALGPRMAAGKEMYNDLFYADGKGWLPAHLDAPAGNDAKPELGASPDPQRFQHPALELFQGESAGSLGRARFPRWWKVTTSARALVGAMLSNADPLLVEQSYNKGQVILCTVPLDGSWASNFQSLWEFPVLIHELVYYLADARSRFWNIQPGQAMQVPLQVFTNGGGPVPEHLLLTPPEGKPVSLKVDAWPFIFERTVRLGSYRLEAENGSAAYFVVHGDPRSRPDAMYGRRSGEGRPLAAGTLWYAANSQGFAYGRAQPPRSVVAFPSGRHGYVVP